MKIIVRLGIIAMTLMALGVVVQGAAAEENFPDSSVDVGSCPAAFIPFTVRPRLASIGLRGRSEHRY